MSLHRISSLLSVSIALAVTGCAGFQQKPYLERLQWGSTPDALGPHVEIVRDVPMTKRLGRCYRREDEGAIVDGVPSRDTEYCFNRGVLYSVQTHFDGKELEEKWQQWLTQVYGHPSKSSTGSFIWDRTGTWIFLGYVTTDYYGPEDTGTVTRLHRRYMPPSDQISCEPWDTAFRACMEAERVRIQVIDAR